MALVTKVISLFLGNGNTEFVLDNFLI